MNDDAALLRRYADTHDEAAFAEIVRRHVNLVHSVALRQVNGDAHLAADVTQLVFTDLARKAAQLARHRVLAGWLFTSARFAAAKLVRGEERRRTREREAQLMQETDHDAGAALDWQRVQPLLDDALGELRTDDREAILLRFFEGRDYANLGAQLRVSDNTARMRVDRALEKLRSRLERRGVTSTRAALAATLGAQAVTAAPASLAGSVATAACASAVATSATGGAIAFLFMGITKLQIGVASGLVLAGAAGYLAQANANDDLQATAAQLRQQNAALATLRNDNLALARAAAEVADLRQDDIELARLRAEAAALKAQVQKNEQLAADAAARAAAELAKLDRAPMIKAQPQPVYPEELRTAGITGTVLVDFIVDDKGVVRMPAAKMTSLRSGEVIFTPGPAGREGKPESMSLTPFIIESDVAKGGQKTGPQGTIAGIPTGRAADLLEKAAMDAVSEWAFNAAQRRGRSVNTFMTVPIVFAAKGDPASRELPPPAGK